MAMKPLPAPLGRKTAAQMRERIAKKPTIASAMPKRKPARTASRTTSISKSR